MNRETSIALHLARVMGKWCPRIENDAVALAYKAGTDMPRSFAPHTNLSQWAECVLWAAMNGHTLTLQKDLVTADFGDAYANPADNTPSGIQAATLEAIARATSWEESK